MTTIQLPRSDRSLELYRVGPPRLIRTPQRAVPPNRVRGRPCGGRPVQRHAMGRTRDRLGRHDGLPQPFVAPGLQSRRGYGHVAARHGLGLGDGAGTDSPLDPRGSRPSGDLASGAGTDHVDPLARRASTMSSGLTRSRSASSKGRRARHPDGEPGPRPRRPRAGRLRPGLRTHPRAGRRPSSCTGSATCSTRRWPATGATRTSTARRKRS